MNAIANIKLQGGAGYADVGLVNDFVEKHQLPAIHDDIGAAMEFVPDNLRRGALDLGACTGLLSVRALRMGWGPVVGLEADRKSAEVFQRYVKPKLTEDDQRQIDVHVAKLNVLDHRHRMIIRNQMKLNRVNTVLLRRVLPEVLVTSFGKLGETAGHIREAGGLLARLFREAGARYLIVEGRVYSPRTTHPLGHIDAEVAALGEEWRVVHSVKAVRVLMPVGEEA